MQNLYSGQSIVSSTLCAMSNIWVFPSHNIFLFNLCILKFSPLLVILKMCLYVCC